MEKQLREKTTKGLEGLWKPIQIGWKGNEIVAKVWNSNTETDDEEIVSDYPISEVLPISYDGEHEIDSSFRFISQR